MLDTHDNTMLSDFHYCERKYALRHILYLVPVETNAALSFGKLLHRGLDAYYKTLKETDKDVIKATEAALTRMEDADFIDPFEDFRTKGRAISTIKEYISQYGVVEQEQDHMEILFTETPFDIEDAEGFRWGGIIDLVFRDLDTDLVWFRDHKSTTRLDKWFFDNFTRDPQMLGYTFGGSELHGEPLAGGQINVIALLTDNDANRRANKVNRFEREEKLYPAWLIVEWKRMVKARLNVIERKRDTLELDVASEVSTPLEAAMDEYNFIPNFHNCIGKYGRCPFFSLCHTRPEKREESMKYDYKVHKWDWTMIDD